VLALLVCAPNSFAGLGDIFSKETPEVLVADPFLEMHTGPGRGYPVFYVAGEGETIKVLKRRTDWFKVELRRGEHRVKQGWVKLEQMRDTLDLGGDPIDFPSPRRGDFETRLCVLRPYPQYFAAPDGYPNSGQFLVGSDWHGKCGHVPIPRVAGVTLFHHRHRHNPNTTADHHRSGRRPHGRDRKCRFGCQHLSHPAIRHEF